MTPEVPPFSTAREETAATLGHRRDMPGTPPAPRPETASPEMRPLRRPRQERSSNYAWENGEWHPPAPTIP
jgi:hypothetical protein